jgi:hypothetical protein
MERIFWKHGETPSYRVSSVLGSPIKLFTLIFAADTVTFRVFQASSFHFPIGTSQFSIPKSMNPTTDPIESNTEPIGTHRNPSEPIGTIGTHRNPSEPSEPIGTHRNPSEPIGTHRNPSEPSEPIGTHRNHRNPSEPIGTHRNPSEPIGTHRNPTKSDSIL